MSTRATVLFSLSVVFASALQAQQNQPPSLTDVMQKLDGIDAKITGLGDRVTKSETRLEGLEAKVNDIATRLNEYEERQREILVATSSGSVLDIRSQMQKPQFRDEFDTAVHDVIRDKTGTFNVTNKMSTYQRIIVNRVEYGISPGKTEPIQVPIGNVTTELPGQEPKNWVVSAPDYTESIDIVPAKQWTTSYRAADYVAPTAPVYTSYYAPTWSTTDYRTPVYTTPVAPVRTTYVVPAPVVVGYAPLRSWWWY